MDIHKQRFIVAWMGAVALFVGCTITALHSDRSMAQANFAHSDGDLPDPKFTYYDPNETVRTTDRADICHTKTNTVRNVPDSLKQRVRVIYGMNGKRDGYCNSEEGCEVDHACALTLGCNNSIHNLWIQPYDPERKWNAHVKDQLEVKMHKMICKENADIPTLQREIATDWISAYKKYVAPEPLPSKAHETEAE